MRTLHAALLSLPLVGFATAAFAQDMPIPTDPQDPGSTRYNVQEMNFDMWCQEQRHLPPERCDKRLPEDDAAFDAYRDKIEKYEIPYLQEQQRAVHVDRDILHDDPVDRPNRPAEPAPGPIVATPPPK